jgi:hypothetical protein
MKRIVSTVLLFNRGFLPVSLMSAFILLAIGCGGDEGGGINLAPQIFVFEVESDIVEPGSQVPVTIEVADLLLLRTILPVDHPGAAFELEY